MLLLDEPLASLDARTRAGAARELATAIAAAAVPTLLVTHDFAEAARLGDEVAVIDGGRIVQRGHAAELAGARRESASSPTSPAPSVLLGVARLEPDGLAHVALDGGGTLASTDRVAGEVAASVFPWDVTLEPPGARRHRLRAEPRRGDRRGLVTVLGNRVRVALLAPQPLSAELTPAGVERLGLRPGARVTAAWKATATRLAAALS